MAYTILVVDDSDTIRAMVQRTLKLTGLPIDKLLEASNGAEALDLLKESWIDIVFTDIHMPRMNGLQLVDAMNQDPVLREIPIVVVSTEGSATRIEELQRKGIKGYLRKPFTPESIRDIIVETLGGCDD
jgi:two-component system, chemotaxis family, chemotaxis protein CheY